MVWRKIGKLLRLSKISSFLQRSRRRGDRGRGGGSCISCNIERLGGKLERSYDLVEDQRSPDSIESRRVCARTQHGGSKQDR